MTQSNDYDLDAEMEHLAKSGYSQNDTAVGFDSIRGTPGTDKISLTGTDSIAKAGGADDLSSYENMADTAEQVLKDNFYNGTTLRNRADGEKEARRDALVAASKDLGGPEARKVLVDDMKHYDRGDSEGRTSVGIDRIKNLIDNFNKGYINEDLEDKGLGWVDQYDIADLIKVLAEYVKNDTPSKWLAASRENPYSSANKYLISDEDFDKLQSKTASIQADIDKVLADPSCKGAVLESIRKAGGADDLSSINNMMNAASNIIPAGDLDRSREWIENGKKDIADIRSKFSDDKETLGLLDEISAGGDPEKVLDLMQHNEHEGGFRYPDEVYDAVMKVIELAKGNMMAQGHREWDNPYNGNGDMPDLEDMTTYMASVNGVTGTSSLVRSPDGERYKEFLRRTLGSGPSENKDNKAERYTSAGVGEMGDNRTYAPLSEDARRMLNINDTAYKNTSDAGRFVYDKLKNTEAPPKDKDAQSDGTKQE